MGSVLAFVLALALQGCAALPLAALGGGALEAGGGALIETGTEYTASGAARRTFTIPLDDMHTAVLEAFRRAEVAVTADEAAKNDRRIVARAEHRTVRVRLTPLTPVLTAMELVVKRNLLASDKATASELLAQTELVLAERPTDGLPALGDGAAMGSRRAADTRPAARPSR